MTTAAASPRPSQSAKIWQELRAALDKAEKAIDQLSGNVGVANLMAQNATLIRERDSRIEASRYWDVIRERDRLSRELTNARLGSELDAKGEAAVAAAVRARDAALKKAAEAEARLEADPGANGRLVRENKRLRTTIATKDAANQNLRRMYDEAMQKLRVTPLAGLTKAEWAILRKCCHPVTGPQFNQDQFNEAAQILNKVVDKLDPPPAQPYR